jgi:hypothetical protein
MGFENPNGEQSPAEGSKLEEMTLEQLKEVAEKKWEVADAAKKEATEATRLMAEKQEAQRTPEEKSKIEKRISEEDAIRKYAAGRIENALKVAGINIAVIAGETDGIISRYVNELKSDNSVQGEARMKEALGRKES